MAEPTYCATHPRVESYLRCSRCGKSICPRCMVQSPVGARCRDCARQRRLPVFVAGPLDLARGLGAGLAVGLLGGALLATPWLRFFHIFLILGLGYLVGRAVTAAANRKRAASLAVMAAASVVVGVLYGPLLWLALQAPQLLRASVLLEVALDALTDPLRVLFVALAAFLAWREVR
ncbi:MAG: hypothetical protein HY690_16435 [Chloroflexi bacterium]|nr:hypothetical protein [Chloroflexota bacterium]